MIGGVLQDGRGWAGVNNDGHLKVMARASGRKRGGGGLIRT